MTISDVSRLFQNTSRVKAYYRDNYGFLVWGIILKIDEENSILYIDNLTNAVRIDSLIKAVSI